MSRPKQPNTLAITAIRMPSQAKLKLESLSHQTGLTQQEHIRRALDAYFDELEREGKFDPRAKRPAGSKIFGRPRKAAEVKQRLRPSGASSGVRRHERLCMTATSDHEGDRLPDLLSGAIRSRSRQYRACPRRACSGIVGSVMILRRSMRISICGLATDAEKANARVMPENLPR